jgi:tetratricopeptide (TPR) repeat protein
VRGTRVSPDGRWVVTGSYFLDGSGVKWKIWEADTGKLVANLPYPDVDGCSGFSPDSRWLYVSGKEDRRLEVASLAAVPVQAGTAPTLGSPRWQGQWKSESVKLEGAFSPDNRVRAYGTHQGVVHLVSPESDQEIARLPTPEVGRVDSPAFSGDGSRLLIRGYESGSLYVFDLRRIREQLAELGLDWEDVQPSLPAPGGDEKATPFMPLRVEMIDAEWATSRAKMSQYETSRAATRLFANPFDADAHSRLGSLRFEEGRDAEARAHLSAALALRPDLDNVYPVRAEAARRLRRWEDAVADATRYLEKYPYAHNVRRLRATANHGRKHEAEAAQDLTMLLSEYPQDIDLWEQRADCYKALGQKEKAAADRAQALKLAAHNPTRLNNQAWQLVTGPEKTRDPVRALALIEKAVEREPDNDLFLNTLGVVQYRNRQYTAAIRSLEKSLAVGKGRSDGFDLFFLAMCHARLDDPARAKDCFERAVKWTEAQKELPPRWAEELRAFRAEAEAALRAP